MLLENTWVDPLITENSVVFADPETRLISYNYSGTITRENTVASAEWVRNLYEKVPHDKAFRGGIFDFRDVTGFEFGIAAVAQKYNREITEKQASSLFPMVYLVSNVRHEVKIRMSLILSVGDAARKCVTYSPDHALLFINEWNLQHNRTFDIPADLLNTWPHIAEK